MQYEKINWIKLISRDRSKADIALYFNKCNQLSLLQK